MYGITSEQIKELRLKLWNWQYHIDEIQMIRDEIAELEAADGVGAVTFDNVPGANGPRISKVEGVVLMKEKKLTFLNRKLGYLLEQRERLIDSIDMLDPKEQILLKTRYIQMYGEDRCRRATGFSSGEYKRLIVKNGLLEKLGRYYYVMHYQCKEWAAQDNLEALEKELEQLQEA